jgi:hypothetical protein
MKPLNLILLLFFVLQACTDRPGVDRFYTDQGEFDMSRFPLIKPYEAVTLVPPVEPGWFISPEDSDTSAYQNISGVKGLNKIDTIIFAYAENTFIEGQRAKKGWFLLIPKNQKLMEFSTEKKYLKYLDSLGIKPPKLFNPDRVLQHYFSKDTLDWEKYNKKH